MPWQIQSETPFDGSRRYHLLATIDDNGNLFSLEASWEQCLYMIHAYEGDEPAGDAILGMCVFADDDPSKFANQVMRMAESDTGNRLRRIEAMLPDSFVMTSDLRQSASW